MKAVILMCAIFFIIALSACTAQESFPNPNIKQDFCGVHINYQYCKCAFHNEYCQAVGMSKSEANTYVQAEFQAWSDSELSEWQATCALGRGIPDGKNCLQEFGVVEKNGNLYLNSKPGEVLIITTNDLPVWARGQIATVGANIAVVGAPDSIAEGDYNVLLDGLPVAREGDSTAQGGVIVEGSTNIYVNGKPVAIIGGQTVNPMVTGVVPHVGGPIIGNP